MSVLVWVGFLFVFLGTLSLLVRVREVDHQLPDEHDSVTLPSGNGIVVTTGEGSITIDVPSGGVTSHLGDIIYALADVPCGPYTRAETGVPGEYVQGGDDFLYATGPTHLCKWPEVEIEGGSKLCKKMEEDKEL